MRCLFAVEPKWRRGVVQSDSPFGKSRGTSSNRLVSRVHASSQRFTGFGKARLSRSVVLGLELEAESVTVLNTRNGWGVKGVRCALANEDCELSSRGNRDEGDESSGDGGDESHF